ncbi:MAG: metalloregulator ArsR/SmtB family transcription factor [Nocardioides sp.]|nr:metalloregulator ArsR/SmtB family transcription factor [Nocardioides sp.]
MSPVPLYQAKADLFRTLGHPVRVRVLELLAERPKLVRELLSDLEIEPSSLSQQLGVLRRSGLVTSSRSGTAVVYSLTTPHVTDLLAASRQILASVWTDTEGLLAELRDSS